MRVFQKVAAVLLALLGGYGVVYWAVVEIRGSISPGPNDAGFPRSGVPFPTFFVSLLIFAWILWPRRNRSKTGLLVRLLILTGVAWIWVFDSIRVVAPSWAFPPMWTTVVLLALAASAFVVVNRWPLSTVPVIPAGLTAEEEQVRAVKAWWALARIRWALVSVVPVIGIYLSTLVSSSWPVTIGLILGLPLLAWHAMTTSRLTAKLQAHLESEGARTHLAEAVQGRVESGERSS